MRETGPTEGSRYDLGLLFTDGLPELDAQSGYRGTVAARAAGTTVSLVRMLPLALLVLLAAALPTNIAGWGPREGAAAWAFSMAGLDAAEGVAVAVVYGVLVLVASLPGAAVLVAGWLRRDRDGVGRRAGVAHG